MQQSCVRMCCSRAILAFKQCKRTLMRSYALVAVCRKRDCCASFFLPGLICLWHPPAGG